MSQNPPTQVPDGSSEKTRLLTVEQVADLLGVPRSWVYGRTRARDRARLPGLRLGKYWRFRESEVRALLEGEGLAAFDDDMPSSSHQANGHRPH